VIPGKKPTSQMLDFDQLSFPITTYIYFNL
jgi:hypothetical protein